ncbi:MAG: SusC/RagA family TonB-linked outer membrane protein [Parabacteroides sp.]|nr:SusC/RagA family TonB-linked outer membrane protein [Parabacteroides sp.]
MRISLILLFITIFCMHAENTISQNARVSISQRNVNLQKVMDEIESQTDYLFIYTHGVDVDRKVSLNVKQQPVKDVLNALFEGTSVDYSMTGSHIILSAGEGKGEDTTSVQQQQNKKITGIVTDSNGETIIGANIMEKGTVNGTITDIDGNFSLTVKEGAILVVSYVGYITQDLPVKNRGALVIHLKEDSQALEEVVVTALGIKREEKAVGYSVQKMSDDDIPMAKAVDITTSLTGKIAGLNIQNNTEFDQDATISLRGSTPLLIVDGIPYANLSINEIAADDIKSVDVLKGATASALYGARGSSGAIMITTKKGSDKDGLNININSNTMFFSGYLAFPKAQHSYSAGTGGKYNNNSVWGDKLDIGRTTVQWDPKTYEYREMELTSKGKDNFNNFLQFSMVTNNNVSVTQKGKYGSFRASATQVYHKGEYPNQKLNKMTFSVGGEMKWQKFSMDATAAYNKRVSSNTVGSGYSSSYIYNMVIWGGTEYDIRDYRDYWVKGKENEMQNWYDKSWYDNPWFKAYEQIASYDTDVFNTSINTSYEITPWLKAMARAGTDIYNKREESRNAISANGAWDKKGYYSINKDTKFSINTDAMLMADKTWGKFNLNGIFGGNIFYLHNDDMLSKTQGGLSIPGYYSLNSSSDPVSATSSLKQKRVNSLYGKASFSWNSTYYLDITGRNDWSSTLRSDERSYFYPSVAGSVILSEILPLPSWWNFLKVRGSWTTTKQDTEIYANNNVYGVITNVWDGLSTASYPETLIGGIVFPQKSETREAGLAQTFFQKRINIDFAYYHKQESDFIINGGVSESTGYKSIQTNSKEQRLRSGIELVVGGTPIQTKDFNWHILTNWSHDKYTYHKLDPDYSTKRPWIKEGADWDWIAIYDWERDPDGNIVHNGGIPVRQTFQKKVGKYVPDLVWGITNTLRYKNWTLSFTFDGRVGGISYSKTHQMLWNSGAHVDSDNQYRYDEVVNGNVSYVGEGVKVVSGAVKRDPDGNVLEDTRVFAPNDVVVSYESYITKYHDSHASPSWQNMLSQTFFKLRNLSLTYEIPLSACKKVGMKNASISFTGQNLLLCAKDFKYADPERGGNTESLNSPSQRYMGFNIKVDF